MNENRIRRRLRVTVLFIVGVAIILLIGSVAGGTYLSNMLQQLTYDGIQSEVDEYAVRIQDQINTELQILNTFSTVFEESEDLDDETLGQKLKKAKLHNQFTMLAYFDASKNGTVAINQGIKILHNVPLMSMPDEVQTVVEESLKGRETVSWLFKSKDSKETVFAYGIPVMRGNNVEGVLVANDDMKAFSDMLDGDWILQDSGYIHMVSSNGEYLIRSDRSVVTEAEKSIFVQPYFDKEELVDVQTALAAGENYSFSFSYEGETYQAILRPVGINNWYLFCISNLQENNVFVYHMIRMITILFVSVIILILLILGVGYRQIYVTGKELLSVAYHDQLTGISNLIYFRREVFNRLKIKNSGSSGSIAILNLHNFKYINDLFGKEKADQLLCHIAEILKEYLKEGCLICRDTADYFYIFMPESDKEILRNKLQKIIDDVIQISKHLGSNYRLSPYCGVIIAEDEGQEVDVEYLLTHVMFALETARENFADSIYFYDVGVSSQNKMINYIESHMHQALEDGEFHLYLQPKVNLRTDTLAGAEALVRWIKKDGEMIYPSDFIPLFEKNGFCIRLDMHMVELVCQQIREWLDEGIDPIPISVNQSKLLFYEADYIENLSLLMDVYRVPPQLITLEILEGLVVENIEELNEKITRLKEKGFKISMDDFGTGYSSLNTLGKLKIDELKLDRGFLMEITKDESENSKLIMEQVIQLSKSLQISTVVEGVETEENNDMIKKLGSDYGQGYFYSRPVSASEFNEKYMNKS